MSPMLEIFAIFALVVFSICCVLALFKVLEELYAHVYYNALINEIASAAIQIERLYPDESIPARDVYFILARLAKREFFDLESMRDQHGMANRH